MGGHHSRKPEWPASPCGEAQRQSPPRSDMTYTLARHPSPTHNQQWRPNTKATLHAGRRPYISAATTSPHTPGSRRGRISVIRRCSSAAAESRTPLQGQEAPPPVRREALALLEEEDSPIEMTSQSMMGCSIKAQSHFHPNQWQNQTIRKTLWWTKVPLEVRGRRKGNQKLESARARKSKKARK